MKLFKSLCALSFSFLLACGSSSELDSSKVNEDDMYGYYQTQFDADLKKVSHFVQFRHTGAAGDPVRLKSPSKVEVNATQMSLHNGEYGASNLEGAFYVQDARVEKPEQTYTFKWTRNNGTTFENTLKMASSFSVLSPAEGSSYSRNSDMTVAFDTPDLQPGERITVSIDTHGSPQKGERSHISRTITSGKQIVFSKEEMATFVDGKATLTAVKVRQETVQNGHTKGGEMISRYFTAPFDLTVTP